MANESIFDPYGGLVTPDADTFELRIERRHAPLVMRALVNIATRGNFYVQISPLGEADLDDEAAEAGRVVYDKNLTTLIADPVTLEEVPVITERDFVGFDQSRVSRRDIATVAHRKLVQTIRGMNKHRSNELPDALAQGIPIDRSPHLPVSPVEGLRVAAVPDILRYFGIDGGNINGYGAARRKFFAAYVNALLNPRPGDAAIVER